MLGEGSQGVCVCVWGGGGGVTLSRIGVNRKLTLVSRSPKTETDFIAHGLISTKKIHLQFLFSPYGNLMPDASVTPKATHF